MDQVATDFYGIRLSMTAISENPYGCNDVGYQFRIRLNFDNRNYMACKTIEKGAMALERKGNFLQSTNCRKEPSTELSSRTLLKLFPFSLIFSQDLKIMSVGYLMKQIFSSRMLIGQILPEVARLRRPRLNLTWENVILFCYRFYYTSALDEILLTLVGDTSTRRLWTGNDIGP